MDKTPTNNDKNLQQELINKDQYINQLLEKIQLLELEKKRDKEELQQHKEEIIAQRQELEKRTKQLERANKTAASSQSVLQKAYEKIKIKEQEVKERNEELLAAEEELRQQNEEILAQRDLLQKTNKNLETSRKVIEKAYLQIKEKEQEVKERNEELLAAEEELRQQNEEILAQRDALDEKTENLEKANKELNSSKKVLEKAFIELKQKEAILREKNEELLAAEEELRQQNEEILAQRDTLEKQTLTLEKSNKRLDSTQKVLEKAYKKIKQSELEIKEKNESLLASEEELRQQNEEILAQKEELDVQKSQLEKNNKKLASTQKVLEKALENIKQKELQLKEKNESLLASEEELRQQNEEILAQREALEEQTRTLEKSNKKLESTQKVLEKALENIKQKELQLKEKNALLVASQEELQQQNEEILAQREKLEIVNQELEKLSIVASETDNAVAIFNQDANLQWVNAGFTRLYGYSFDEFLQKVGKNLFETTTNPKIKQVINECITNKKSVIYQSQNITAKGEMIWAQTTLTPLFNSQNELEKLIAIDTNIQKLKEAEKEIAEQKEELLQKNVILDEQNQHIKSSISYAKTIQQAILPTVDLINKHFENFIIYRPKDIVSGDFFWFNSLNINEIDYIFCIVADCTGHGVPGAFMSMIGYSILNQIILENKNIEPANILEELNLNIRKALKQDTSDNSDGMDVCLCRFNSNENLQKVTFAGAKRPLIYYNSEKKVIEVIKGSHKTIGGAAAKRNKTQFEQKKFTINNNDVFYLSSDGYIDQNNHRRQRIGTPKLLEILNENAEKQLTEQKQILENFLNNFMQNEQQRDDITFIAIKNHK